MAWLIRRSDRKSGCWYVCFRASDGRVVRRAAGSDRRSAERIRSKIETQVREGRFFEREMESDWSLERLSKVYLERMARTRPRSARWRQDMFRQILKVLPGNLLVERIDMETLDRYVIRRRGEGKAPSTVNREVSVLRHSLHLAARWKAETHLSRYRLTDWTPLREAPSARQAVFLSREEVARVLAAASERAAHGGLNGRHAEAVIQLALATGARLGEILSINWEDIDARGVVRIRTEKNGPDRSIQLSDEALKFLEPFRDPGNGYGLIFRSSRTGRRRGHVRNFWRAVRKAAKIEHVRFHDLRHTAASEMLRRGMMIRDVQYALGHSTVRMTERYAHFAPSFQPPKALTWSLH
jgi:integrase